MRRITIFLIFYLSLSSINLFSEPVSIIQTGVENSGAGGTGAAYYSGISSIYYNSASLFLERKSLLDFQIDYNNLNLYRLYSLGYFQPIKKKLAMGLNFLYYKPADIIVYNPENNYREKIGKLSHILNISISSKIIKEINYGVNFRLINNSYGDDSYIAVSLDYGILYLPKKLKNNLAIGINFMNFISTAGVLNEEKVVEPFNIKLGAGYSLPLKKHSLFFTVDINSKKEYFPQYCVGMRYSYRNIFNLSLGYNEKVKFTAGAGINYSPYKINYSFIKSKENNNSTHKLSVTFYFRLKLSEEMMERYYNKAIRYYNDFKFKEAFDIFKELYRTDRNYRETAYYYELLKKRIRERELAESERLEQAEKLYKEAVKFYNKKQYTLAKGNLIECLKRNIKHIEARRLLNRIHQIQKEEETIKKAKVREKEGDYYFSLGQYASALVEYNESLKLNPDNELLKLKIEKTKKQLGKENTSALGYRLYREGKSLFEKGEYTKAISKWEEALIALPNFTLVKLEIEKAKRLIKEQEDAETLNRMFADQIQNFFKVADYNYKNNNFVEALFQIESILEMDPHNRKALEYKKKILTKIKVEKIKDKKKRKIKEEYHLSEGIKSFKKNKLEDALFHFGKVIALNPKKSASIKELATVLQKISELEKQGINKDSPNYRLIESHYRKGMKYFTERKFEQAVAEWKRVLKIIPENIKIASQFTDAEAKAKKEKEERLAKFHLNRAIQFLREGKKDMAIAEAKRILAILPDNKEAKDIITQCVSGIDKTKTVNSYLEKAADLFDDEKYSEAIQEIRLVLAIDPENKLAQKRLMECEEKLKEIERKSQIENYISMAERYFEHENYSMARKYINKVLSLDRENSSAKDLLKKIEEKEMDVKVTEQEKLKLVEIFNKGLNQFLEGNYDECIKNMRKVLVIDPDNIQALKFIEKAKAKIKEKEKEAIEPQTKLIDKKLVWAHYLKGINYYTSGDLDNAIKEWREALRLDPNNEKIRRSLKKAMVKKEMLK